MFSYNILKYRTDSLLVYILGKIALHYISTLVVNHIIQFNDKNGQKNKP